MGLSEGGRTGLMAKQLSVQETNVIILLTLEIFRLCLLTHEEVKIGLKNLIRFKKVGLK